MSQEVPWWFVGRYKTNNLIYACIYFIPYMVKIILMKPFKCKPIINEG